MPGVSCVVHMLVLVTALYVGWRRIKKRNVLLLRCCCCSGAVAIIETRVRPHKIITIFPTVQVNLRAVHCSPTQLVITVSEHTRLHCMYVCVVRDIFVQLALTALFVSATDWHKTHSRLIHARWAVRQFDKTAYVQKRLSACCDAYR